MASPVAHAVGPTRSAPPPPAFRPAQGFPCDPGLGHPDPSPTCPDHRPETGWLETRPGGGLALERFRTLVDDAAGRAYAHRHHLAFPFPDDHLDAPLGGARSFSIPRGTVCTGSIRVGYREPLDDHRVSCGLLVRATSQAPLPVVVWRYDGRLRQVSELYRP